MAGLYALPPGVDFAECFAAGLLARHGGGPPEALARVTVHANSSRTLAAIRDALEARGALLLPRLRLIAELGEGPVSSPLGRRLELGSLIAGLVRAQPALAGGQAVPALAESLAALMAEMQSEGCAPDALDHLDVAEHAEHWRLSLAFVRIAAAFHLLGAPRDREARQRAAAEAAAADWAAGRNLPPGPVIVAGSTGSHGATRLFMQAVARLPQGAVVLPGFDAGTPAGLWPAMAQGSDDHPQARFAPLIEEFGLPHAWHDTPPADPPRNALISLSLRPAPVTDQWIAEGPALGDLVAASAGLTLVEAPDPQTEAEAIAAAIREAVEEGERVTLIAADRLLTRRVTAALDRWGLVPDDGAGQPLPLTPPGLFLRQIAALNGRPLTLDVLLALLKSPMAAGGTGHGAHLLSSRQLELHLRERGPAFPDGAFLREWAAGRGTGAADWAAWLAPLVDHIRTLQTDRAERPLPDRLAELQALAEALAAGPGGDPGSLWLRQDGGLARAVMDHLATEAQPGHRLTARDLSALLEGELQSQALRLGEAVHPLIRIRGPREARTEAVGRVILGGLNEGSWPQALPADPWLSRPMRLAAGLTLPERRVGLAAHDFQQAVAARRVILTRARRDAEADTVPSRWLNRLTNLMTGLPAQAGPEALEAMRARGAELVRWGQLLGQPERRVPPAPRPAPLPPAPGFRQLSVTRVATLIRDPYAIYASAVLGLRPLPPMHPQADPSLRGEVFHAVANRFLAPAPPPGTPPAELAARFLAAAGAVLEAEVPWPAARAFWMHRLRQITPRLMEEEAARLAAGQPVVLEESGKLPVPGLELVLTARPDRIDELPDGSAHIYDYKSGKAPSDRQIEAYDKQLPLTAALVSRGAFPALAARRVEGMSYISLTEKGGTSARTMADEDIDAIWQRFVALARRYLTGQAGFTARRSMADYAYGSDYDHLSRYGEWSAATDPTPTPLRHED